MGAGQSGLYSDQAVRERWHGIARHTHEPEVDIGRVKLLERVEECLLDLGVVIVVELCCQEERLARDTGVLDTLANLSLIACRILEIERCDVERDAYRRQWPCRCACSRS